MRGWVGILCVVALAGGPGIVETGCGSSAGVPRKDAGVLPDVPISSGGVAGTGGMHGSGGVTGTGGLTSTGGGVGTGGLTTVGGSGGATSGGSNGTALDGAAATGGASGVGGAGGIGAGAGGANGTGGAATGGATGTGGAGTGGKGTGGSGTGGNGTGGSGLVAAACAAEPLRTTGHVYYFCDCLSAVGSRCIAGKDSNPGTITEPFQTFAKAAATFSSMNAGDTIAFCRGGQWYKTGGSFVNPTCTKDATCDIRDYAPPWGDGTEGNPVFRSSSSTMFSFLHDPASPCQGYRLMNLDLQGSTSSTGGNPWGAGGTTGAGITSTGGSGGNVGTAGSGGSGGAGEGFTAILFHNRTTDVDICNVSINGFDRGVDISAGDNAEPEGGPAARIRVRGSRFSNVARNGYIGIGDDLSVEDCVFENCGGIDRYWHAVSFTSASYHVNGQTTVHTSTGARLGRSHIRYTTQECPRPPVGAHGRQKGVVFENNVLEAERAAAECWGLVVDCGEQKYGCLLRDTVIRGNIMKNLGEVGADISQCQGCLIENNLIVNSGRSHGIALNAYGPRGNDPSEYPDWDGQPDANNQDVTVRNNTIVLMAPPSNTVSAGIHALGGTGYRFFNNAILFQDATGYADCYQFMDDDPTAVVAAADRNVCQIPSGSVWVNDPWFGSGYSLSSWQAEGFDKHSLQADPQFTSVPSDLTPAAGSPLIGLSDPANSPTVDLTGKPRDSQPDVGAFER